MTNEWLNNSIFLLARAGRTAFRVARTLFPHELERKGVNGVLLDKLY